VYIKRATIEEEAIKRRLRFYESLREKMG